MAAPMALLQSLLQCKAQTESGGLSQTGAKNNLRCIQHYTRIVPVKNSTFLTPRLASRLLLNLQKGRVLPFYANGRSVARMVGRYSDTVG